MPQLSISRAWEESRAIFARDGGLITAVALALLVLPATVAGVITPPVGGRPSYEGRVISLIAGCIGLAGQLAIVRLAIGPSTTVGQAIQHGVRRFLPTFAAVLMLVVAFAVIVIPVMLLLIWLRVVGMPVEGQQPPASFAIFSFAMAIAALLVSIKFCMIVPVSVAQQPGPLTILKRSWSITSGNYWRLLGFMLLIVVAAIIVLLAAQFVGLFAARLIAGNITPLSLAALVLSLFRAVASAGMTILFALMLSRIYLQLAGRNEVHASVPSSGI
jgi:Membrane domain of glycerophosphoryl diester phosphodiesterase